MGIRRMLIFALTYVPADVPAGAEFVKGCKALVISVCEASGLSVHYSGVSGYKVAVLLVAALL